ncbi:DUF4292 domain-containing protein [Kaistella palustris]|uniref:DUF4292 domain-containing protein n=1 Tax=Kaistella palustris TaxID=493376 RepID=UPI000404C1FD|nr:DUF4292 domain-containing protein [Kaistella palustris]
MKKYILTLLLPALLLSCAVTTPVNSPTDANAPIANTSAFFSNIKAAPDFSQIKINSRVDVETGKFIPTLDATIYIEKDRKVWMNMIAVILNVGRGVATPEGIQGYEKWNKTYIESDFSYLNNLLHVDFIDFQSLQNLLIGRTFIPVSEKDFVLSKNAEGYRLTSAKNLKFGENGKVSEYAVTMKYSSDLDLMDISLVDKHSGDTLEVNYSNWVSFENMRLPKNVKIMIKGSKSSQIFLENTKFESSKMETPYSVPNNYTKTEIK